MTENFKQGEAVKYTGKGFLGFDSADSNMIYIKKDVGSIADVWVEYKGNKMLVRNHEIEKIK